MNTMNETNTTHTMNRTSSYYAQTLYDIRMELHGVISSLVSHLGGNINMEFYHDECDVEYNKFLWTDADGAFGLIVKQINTNEDGELEFVMYDEDSNFVQRVGLEFFGTSDALHLLIELEDVAEIVEKEGEVVSDEDFDW